MLLNALTCAHHVPWDYGAGRLGERPRRRGHVGLSYAVGHPPHRALRQSSEESGTHPSPTFPGCGWQIQAPGPGPDGRCVPCDRRLSPEAAGTPWGQRGLRWGWTLIRVCLQQGEGAAGPAVSPSVSTSLRPRRAHSAAGRSSESFSGALRRSLPSGGAVASGP